MGGQKVLHIPTNQEVGHQGPEVLNTLALQKVLHILTDQEVHHQGPEIFDTEVDQGALCNQEARTAERQESLDQ